METDRRSVILVIQNEAARPVIPENSMDECVAMTQAMIGYPLQQHIYNELQTRKSDLQVATIVTQVLVDRDKLESLKPTKPIGPFYTKEQARQIAEETGMVMAEDSGGATAGWLHLQSRKGSWRSIRSADC